MLSLQAAPEGGWFSISRRGKPQAQTALAAQAAVADLRSQSAASGQSQPSQPLGDAAEPLPAAGGSGSCCTHGHQSAGGAAAPAASHGRKGKRKRQNGQPLAEGSGAGALPPATADVLRVFRGLIARTLRWAAILVCERTSPGAPRSRAAPSHSSPPHSQQLHHFMHHFMQLLRVRRRAMHVPTAPEAIARSATRTCRYDSRVPDMMQVPGAMEQVLRQEPGHISWQARPKFCPMLGNTLRWIQCNMCTRPLHMLSIGATKRNCRHLRVLVL